MTSARLTLIVGALLGAATPAFADALRVELFTKVAQGQKPRVRLTATEPVESLSVELNRDDGKLVSSSRPTLGTGASHELMLPDGPGKAHYEGRVTFRARGEQQESRLSFDAIVAPPLQVQIDRAKVDQAARMLEARLSRPAGKIQIRVQGATAGAAVEAEQDATGRAAGEPISVSWPALPDGSAAARIELRFFDVDGFFTGMALTPWNVHIPHEEVTFATDSATITTTEEPKLLASLKLIADALTRHRELGAIGLYVAGHTDTQGAAPYNVKLSQRRAQAISAWFKKRGLRIAIFFEGFGEHAPIVATADNTDEPRNRRVDYILAVEEPTLRSTGFRAAWKRLP